ncbi:MAG: LuxR C-terminal-related transcriptional regulator [Ardenticatenaceae bacterium]|nr:LuxR C-terminal-related transcriptional regulator [Ardenticatenaceae bacterium]
MNIADPLIRTKLRLPFVRPEQLTRPRLQKQIERGLRGPLTLVTAPAGFGKTTLVASCLQQSNIANRVSWVSLDKNDNQSRRFLRYLIAALQTADSNIGKEASQLMTASLPVCPEAVLSLLLNDLDAADQRQILVLDDYQFITDRVIHDGVEFLLEHRPQTFHLLIISRSDPPLPIGRLRARGQLVEVRAADLSFTKHESSHFLNDVMGLQLDSQSVATLAERTEGWVTGLQLAALSIRDHDNAREFIEGFSGTYRHILDYLLEEVLAREPEEVRAFLQQTSILTQLHGGLCDAVTGTSNGRDMLEQLERSNLFVVPLDDERRWYRYHHLFADLLQARLRRSADNHVAQLFTRAAEWCENNGQVTEAVSYALAAHNFDRAAALIERQWGPAISEGEVETVWSWLKAVPEEIIRHSISLSTACSWVLWLRGQIELIEVHLVNAERAMSSTSEDGKLDDDLPAQLAALRALVDRYHGEFETAEAAARRALNLLPKDLPSPNSAELRSLLFATLASVYDGSGELEKAVSHYAETIRWGQLSKNAVGVAGATYRLSGILRHLGRLRDAEAVCRDALTYMKAQGMTRLPAVGILHLALCEVLVEQNKLAAAEEHLAQGVELGRWSGRLDAVRNAAPSLTRLRLARGDGRGALRAISKAQAALGEPPSSLAQAELLALKARIFTWQGDPIKAARCATEAVELSAWDKGLTGETVALAAVRVQAAQCKPAEAVALLTQSITAAERSGRFGAAIELYLLRCLALNKQGKSRLAEADLERALILAEPQGFVRVFLEEGRPLLQRLASWTLPVDDSSIKAYAAHLLSQFGVTSPIDPAVEPLSSRELEVLQLIALGKTNREIAGQLVVSPGTVKAHTSNIYRKLDVANRTEAVARARQLNLLN